MAGGLFTKYQKVSETKKILLIYLILNHYDISKIERVEEYEDKKAFGLKLYRKYGITREYVDDKKIDDDIAATISPQVCSPSTYELYANSPVIYCYTPDNNGMFNINDMGILSDFMVITKDCIITSNRDSGMNSQRNGFMYFYEYVIKSEVRIGKWHIQFTTAKDEDGFPVQYFSIRYKAYMREDLLYQAVELSKSSTYQLVLYIINKVYEDLNEDIQPAHYCEEIFERKGRS